jgi:hypothetical protein
MLSSARVLWLVWSAGVLALGMAATAQEIVPPLPPKPAMDQPQALPLMEPPAEPNQPAPLRAVSQESPLKPAANVASETAQPAVPAPLQDPTQPSPMLRELLDPEKAQSTGIDLPVVSLKGRIVGGLRPAMAMLEVDKQFVVVQQGSEITVQGSRVGLQVLRVVEVGTNGIRLEIAPSLRKPDNTAKDAASGETQTITRSIVLH